MFKEGVTTFKDAEKLEKGGQKNQAMTKYLEAAALFRQCQEVLNNGTFIYNLAFCYYRIGEMMNDRAYLEKSLEAYKECREFLTQYPESESESQEILENANEYVGEITEKLEAFPVDKPAKPTETIEIKTQQTTETQAEKPADKQAMPSGQAGGAKPISIKEIKEPAPKPGPKPAVGQESAQAPEIKPIVSVQLGYSFKRIKLTGKYEVDMRKRLREDREIVMSGNVSGVYQRYGEDKRFFTVVSLNDPTFQERTIEVILDGQDAEDFKN